MKQQNEYSFYWIIVVALVIIPANLINIPEPPKIIRHVVPVSYALENDFDAIVNDREKLITLVGKDGSFFDDPEILRMYCGGSPDDIRDLRVFIFKVLDRPNIYMLSFSSNEEYKLRTILNSAEVKFQGSDQRMLAELYVMQKLENSRLHFLLKQKMAVSPLNTVNGTIETGALVFSMFLLLMRFFWIALAEVLLLGAIGLAKFVPEKHRDAYWQTRSDVRIECAEARKKGKYHKVVIIKIAYCTGFGFSLLQHLIVEFFRKVRTG